MNHLNLHIYRSNVIKYQQPHIIIIIIITIIIIDNNNHRYLLKKHYVSGILLSSLRILSHSALIRIWWERYILNIVAVLLPGTPSGPTHPFPAAGNVAYWCLTGPFLIGDYLRPQVAAKARPSPWGQSATNHWPMQECKGPASAFLLARMELSPWGHPKGHPSPELPVVSAEGLVATTLGRASPSSQTCPVFYLQLYLSRALPNKPADSFPSQSLLSGNPDWESGFQKWS